MGNIVRSMCSDELVEEREKYEAWSGVEGKTDWEGM